MAQAQTAVQAEVNVRTLNQRDARHATTHPFDLSRRGEIRSLTLTIPLLTERNAYLVVRVPDATVRELMQHVQTLPAPERPAFIREWVRRNQQAILEQHIRVEGRERRFRYDVVPVLAPPRVGDAVPRRTEERVQPESPHRLVEQRRFYDDGRDQAPQGWRAPRSDELPQEVRTRANQLQPRDRRGEIPLGEGRIEEYNGRRYLYLACYHTVPAPRHASISVFVQTERVISPGDQERTPPPSVRVPAAGQQRVELPPLPSQITGGNGSTQRPYEVRPAAGRERGDVLAASAVDIPFSFQIEGVGTVKFLVHLTLSQMARSRRTATQTELRTIFTAGIQRRAQESGRRLDQTAVRDAMSSLPRAFSEAVSRVEAQDREMAVYMREN